MRSWKIKMSNEGHFKFLNFVRLGHQNQKGTWRIYIPLIYWNNMSIKNCQWRTSLIAGFDLDVVCVVYALDGAWRLSCKGSPRVGDQGSLTSSWCQIFQVLAIVLEASEGSKSRPKMSSIFYDRVIFNHSVRLPQDFPELFLKNIKIFGPRCGKSIYRGPT